MQAETYRSYKTHPCFKPKEWLIWVLYAVSDRDDKELACDHDYRILASYVEHQADGNETQILSSGFHATKQPVQQQKATLEVVNGEHPGSVKFIAKAS